MFAALRFLTLLPLPGDRATSAGALSWSKPWFPVVGLLIGGAAAPFAWAAHHLLPPLPAAVLLVLFLLAVSGGLHADGLADTADGFCSDRSRERVLEIMRDSRIGSFGALALLFVGLLKVSAFAGLDGRHLLAAAFLAPLAGRASLVQMLAALPCARSDGLAHLFYATSSLPAFLLSAGLILGSAWLAAGWEGLAAVLAALLVVHLLCRACRKRIGGATGDTLGAACELAEAAVPLAFAAYPRLAGLLPG